MNEFTSRGSRRVFAEVVCRGAVYLDTMEEKSIVAIRPKPAFRAFSAAWWAAKQAYSKSPYPKESRACARSRSAWAIQPWCWLGLLPQSPWPVLERLRQLGYPYGLGAGQVGNGEGQLEDTVKGSGRQV